MTANGWLQIGVYFLAILLVTKPLGVYLARVFGEEKTFLDPVLRPTEVRALVVKHAWGRQFGLLGEPRINVLELNLDLDAQHPLSK